MKNAIQARAPGSAYLRSAALTVVLLLSLAAAYAQDLAQAHSRDQNPANLLDFQTEDVEGQPIDLLALKEQWVVVNYWATWCKPCLKEIPDLSDLHTRRPDVSLLGLTYEETTAQDVRDFLGNHPASYPIALVDVANPPAAFGTPRVLPTTLLIAPDGTQRKRFIGPVTSEMIETEIASQPEFDG